MADALLEIRNPKTIHDFAARLTELSVQLPLSADESQPGVVLDSAGRDVFTADSNGNRSDFEALQIAMWIVLAVNTCAGFRLNVATGN